MMKKVFVSALFCIFGFSNNAYGIRRVNVKIIEQHSQQLDLPQAIRSEVKGIALTHSQLTRLPDEWQKACCMIRGINGKELSELNTAERAISDFFSNNRLGYYMAVGRFPGTLPRNCSDDELASMLIIFLASDVYPKISLIVDSAALRTLAFLLDKYPELSNGFGNTKINASLDDDVPLRPIEVCSLARVSGRISEFHVVNRVGESGERRKVITEDLIYLLNAVRANNCLEKISFHIGNCDGNDRLADMYKLLFMDQRGKISSRSLDNMEDLLANKEARCIEVTWRLL